MAFGCFGRLVASSNYILVHLHATPFCPPALRPSWYLVEWHVPALERSSHRWPTRHVADYLALIDAQNKIFEQLLDGSVGGSALILSLDIKNAEMATKDLVALVRISYLKMKDTLARSLEDFVFDAKKTGQGLQKLISKFGEAVDKCVYTNFFL